MGFFDRLIKTNKSKKETEILQKQKPITPKTPNQTTPKTSKPPTSTKKHKTPNSIKLTELDRIKIFEEQEQLKCANRDYYFSDLCKENALKIKKQKEEYIKNNPTDFSIRGIDLCKQIWIAIDTLPKSEVKIIELIGEAYYYEKDLEQYETAVELYNKAYSLTWETIGDELGKMIKDYGEGDYLYTATIKRRLKVCENKLSRAKIKNMELEAKSLEKTDPLGAIELYGELNILNPNLKKYNKRIEILKRKLNK